jgi:hypothetical protein
LLFIGDAGFANGLYQTLLRYHSALAHQLEKRPPRLAAGASGGGDVAARAA